MKIYALSDLHLSLDRDYHCGEEPSLYKSMEVFGSGWNDYFHRLDENWRSTVSDGDIVLIAGDISWALTLPESAHDLAYLGSLPGRKLLCKGNHDYWWNSLSRVRACAPQGLEFLQHSAVQVGGWAVCGTRGWLSPQQSEYKASKDKSIYERELIRLEMALREAAALELPIIAMLHFPPLLTADEDSAFAALLERYGVRLCVYGHIHGEKLSAFEGERSSVLYRNISMDRLAFQPLLLVDDEGRLCLSDIRQTEAGKVLSEENIK